MCPSAWQTIHAISRATYYRYKEMATLGKQAEGHGNLGSKKPRMHTMQAIATLRVMIGDDADRMPNKTRTLNSGERVPAMVLPSAFRWKDQLPKINDANAALNLKPISTSNLSRIRKESFAEYAPKGRGDSFARCGTCDEYKQLCSACTPMSVQQEKWEKVLENHLAGQKAHRKLYYAHRYISEEYPEKMVTIIHDKMDHSKTASPHFSHKSKATESFMKLPVAITGMIAHGHGDVRYAHYGLDIYPMNPNHTIGSIAKLLRDLEGVPRSASRSLFTEEGEQSTLTKALLKGAEICRESLLPTVEGPEGAKQLPPILTLQLDNACADNKNRWVFAFCSMLVYKRIFREVYINFLIVGHTHEDIDALFGRWSTRLKTRDYPTVPLLMKSFMDCETEPVIPHLIGEVPDFKSFVEGYLGRGGQNLEGHSKVQQFKFHMDPSGWPVMEYKHMCTDKKWLPEDGKGIRFWAETEENGPRVPTGSPRPVRPQEMRSIEEIKKGLDGYIEYWRKMADSDESGEFRRKNDPVKDYWKGVREALDEPMQERERLMEGFWPASRVEEEEADHMDGNGRVGEEYEEDAPFVGRRCDRPRPSFRVMRDTYGGYFVVVRPAEGDMKPFWLGRAMTNPSPDPNHVHMIKIQYWRPVRGQHINEETYEGWDTREGNGWQEDRAVLPTWANTDCIMTAWKPRCAKGTNVQMLKIARVRIPKMQISIIKESVEAFRGGD